MAIRKRLSLISEILNFANAYLGKVTKFQGYSLFRFGVLSNLLAWRWKTSPSPPLVWIGLSYCSKYSLMTPIPYHLISSIFYRYLPHHPPPLPSSPIEKSDRTHWAFDSNLSLWKFGDFFWSLLYFFISLSTCWIKGWHEHNHSVKWTLLLLNGDSPKQYQVLITIICCCF